MGKYTKEERQKYGQYTRICKHCGMRGKKTPGDFCDEECERFYNQFKEIRKKNKGERMSSHSLNRTSRSNSGACTQISYNGAV